MPVRFVVYCLAAAMFVVVTLTMSSWLWLRTALPENSFALVGSESGSSILITRDQAGLPTVEAQSDSDAAFGLGYLHAQDRLFQMDLMRRYGRGRLSEWFGEAALGSDQFMRVLGFSERAELQYRRLSPSLQRILQSYADGVNANWSRGHALPPEYYVLNAQFERWRPEDSLIWAKLIDLELTGNFKDELLHAALIKALPEDDLRVLFPTYPVNAPVVVQQTKAELQNLPIEELYATLPSRVGAFEASNNWVVSAEKSSTGKPLLANDPHLGFSIPSAWYLVRLKTPSDTLAGAGAAGVPFILIGHNTRIAWGITATRSDVEDLFIEQIEGDDQSHYSAPDGAMPFSVRHETIVVKGRSPVEMAVRATRHGPVLSDLPAFATRVSSSRQVLALQATWLSDDDESPESAWALSHAHDWNEFRNGLRELTAPQQNFVYADVMGNIGFISAAKVPVRKNGNGWLPVPGWSGEYDWESYVPFDQLPTAFNPSGGLIASANNKPDDRGQPFLAQDWIPPYRAERIKELLEAKPVFSVDDMASIQLDTVSLAARQLVPLLVPVKIHGGVARKLADQLLRWDGRMDAGLTEPLVFSAWLRELTKALLQRRLGPLFQDYAGFHPDVIYLILTEHPDWCRGDEQNEKGGCEALIARSFEHAVEWLTAMSGLPPWRWGDWHEAVYNHPVWSRFPVLSRALSYRFAVDGGADTISNSAVSFWNDGAPFQSYFGSTLRMVVDLSNVDNARFMIVPGESGNPVSSHYDDLISLWRHHHWLKFSNP